MGRCNSLMVLQAPSSSCNSMANQPIFRAIVSGAITPVPEFSRTASSQQDVRRLGCPSFQEEPVLNQRGLFHIIPRFNNVERNFNGRISAESSHRYRRTTVSHRSEAASDTL